MYVIDFPRLRLLGFALVFLTASASADVFEDLEIHGFATQGFVKTSANRFFGNSEKGSFDFREIGINAAFQPLDDLRLSGQILSRKAGDMYSASPAIDFAIADFTLASSPSYGLNLLVGRVKNPIGLFNDTRDVAFTRPGVFLPQTVYFDKVRNLFLSADGIALRWSRFGSTGNVNVYAAVGKPLVDDNVEYTYLGANHAGDLFADDLAFSGRIEFSTASDRWRFALSMASVSMDFKPARNDRLPPGDVSFDYWLSSMQYDGDVLTFTAEYMLEPIQWSGFSGSFFSDYRAEAESYYVQAAFRVDDHMQLTVRYEKGVFNRDDPSGIQLSQRTFGLIPPSAGFSRIWTAGLRWDLSHDWMLMADYQWHDGTYVLSGKENDGRAVDPNWDLFALTVSYRF